VVENRDSTHRVGEGRRSAASQSPPLLLLKPLMSGRFFSRQTFYDAAESLRFRIESIAG